MSDVSIATGGGLVSRPQPSKFYRWLVLIFISLTMFGNYYVYDALSPIADLLAKAPPIGLGFTDQNIGLLQAIYSFPNIFTVLIGGILLDRIGLRRATLLFGILCLVGPIITVATPTLWVMAAGRLIFGMGAESINVAATAVLARWFRGKELSFAFGINLTIARLGSFVALNSPTWAKPAFVNWRYPFLIAVGVASLCVVGALIYWIMEVEAERKYQLGAASTDKVAFSDLSKLVWAVVAGVVLFVLNYFPVFKMHWARLFAMIPGRTMQGFGRWTWIVLTVAASLMVLKAVVEGVVRFGGLSYFYIVALCITFYSGIFPFQTFAVIFFMDKHDASRAMGGFLSSMLTLFAMVVTPLFGLMVDRVGKRALLMMFGSLLLIPVYLMMAYVPAHWVNLAVPWLAHGQLVMHSFTIPLMLFVEMAMMGVAFSLIPAVMWPSVAYIVDPGKLGTAYGLMTMIQNIGLFGFNLLIGWENTLRNAGGSHPAGYNLGMWTFSILGFMGMAFAFLLRQRETSPLGHGLERITTKTGA
jgi:MFS family permease